MLTNELRRQIAATTRLLQIIVLALFAGLLSFGVITVTVLEPPAPLPPPTLSPLAAGFAALQAGLAVAVPKLMNKQQGAARSANQRERQTRTAQNPSSDASSLLAGYQVRRIIAGALLEGAGFFNLVAYQRERQAYTLAVVAAILAALLALIPWPGAVERRVEQDLRLLRDARDLDAAT